MKSLQWTLTFCLLFGTACSNAVGGEGSEDGEAVGEVEGAGSALGACTVIFRRSSLLEGFVDTLSCGNNLCTRSCSILDPTKCSTRCFPNPPGLGTAFLDQNPLRPECRMDPASRVNAGYPGISKTLCEVRGGCWDNRTRDPNFPWCYEPLGMQPTCGNQTTIERINAGTPRTTGEQCVLVNAACWDERVRNVPFCFLPTANSP